MQKTGILLSMLFVFSQEDIGFLFQRVIEKTPITLFTHIKGFRLFERTIR